MNNPITEPGYYWIQSTFQGETFTDLLVVNKNYKPDFKFIHWNDFHKDNPTKTIKDYCKLFDDELMLYGATNLTSDEKLNWKPLESFWIDQWIKIEKPTDPNWTCNYR